MKTLILFFLFILVSCQAQETKLIISEESIHDMSNTFVYQTITDTVNNEVVWKDEYKYIDSIDMSWITYVSDGLKIKGMVVKPKKSGKYPCIIYNRGGNTSMGALTIDRAIDTMGKLAKEGYVVIASNYRGSPGSEGKDEFGGADINDVLILPEVLKEIEFANSGLIGMYGWSRGGLMTYLSLTKSKFIKAAVIGAGSTNVINNTRLDMERMFKRLIPDIETKREEVLKQRSPIYWVDKFPKDVPILLLQGNADWHVKSENTLKLALEFEKYRIPYRLKIFEGGNHGLTQFKTEVDSDVLNWFNMYLKKEESIPDMSLSWYK